MRNWQNLLIKGGTICTTPNAGSGNYRELATKRTRALYKAKGYSDEWIEKRMRGIAIREELTDEWKKREDACQKEKRQRRL